MVLSVFAPVNVPLAPGPSCGHLVSRSHQGLPRPWCVLDMQAQLGDVLVLHARTAHCGGGIGPGQDPPRVVAFWGLSTTVTTSFEVPEAVGRPPWAQVPPPVPVCSVTGCGNPVSGNGCLCCDAPLCPAHAAQVCPRCAAVTLTQQTAPSPDVAPPTDPLPVDVCAAALMPIALTTLALQVQVPTRGALHVAGLAGAGDIPAHQCPLRDVVHEGAVLPPPSDGEHLLLAVDPGTVVVIRHSKFGGFCTVPVDAQGPGVVPQCIRWDMPLLRIPPHSLTRASVFVLCVVQLSSLPFFDFRFCVLTELAPVGGWRSCGTVPTEALPVRAWEAIGAVVPLKKSTTRTSRPSPDPPMQCRCGQSTVDPWPQMEPLPLRHIPQAPRPRRTVAAPLVGTLVIGPDTSQPFSLAEGERLLLRTTSSPLQVGGSMEWYAEARYQLVSSHRSQDIVVHMPCPASLAHGDAAGEAKFHGRVCGLGAVGICQTQRGDRKNMYRVLTQSADGVHVWRLCQGIADLRTLGGQPLPQDSLRKHDAWAAGLPRTPTPQSHPPQPQPSPRERRAAGAGTTPTTAPEAPQPAPRERSAAGAGTATTTDTTTAATTTTTTNVNTDNDNNGKNSDVPPRFRAGIGSVCPPFISPAFPPACRGRIRAGRPLLFLFEHDFLVAQVIGSCKSRGGRDLVERLIGFFQPVVQCVGIILQRDVDDH